MITKWEYSVITDSISNLVPGFFFHISHPRWSGANTILVEENIKKTDLG